MLPKASRFTKLGPEFHPPVAGLGSLVLSVNLRFRFTVKGNLDDLRLDATGDKLVLDPRSAPVREADVVSLRPQPGLHGQSHIFQPVGCF